MTARFPVAIYTLEQGDEGFDKGAMCRVDLVDGDAFYFRSLDAARQFLDLHGLQHVNEADMIALRRATGRQ